MKKILLVLISLVLLAITCFFLLNNNNDEYEDYISTEDNQPVYSIIGDNGDINVSGDYVSSEEVEVLKYFGMLGIQCGITKIEVSNTSDVEPPEIVIEYGVDYYYSITTSRETYNAIFVDGELITDYK